MKPIWFVVLVTLLLLPASRLWAQPDLELYSAEVCNEGQITVDVAVAYKDFSFSSEFWVIDGWYDVPKGKCKTVFAHSYVKQDRNWLGFRSFPSIWPLRLPTQPVSGELLRSNASPALPAPVCNCASQGRASSTEWMRKTRQRPVKVKLTPC